MLEKPLISIIVPIYNVEKYLSKCIESIVRQTYENLQIILVNDGSTDNCKQICEKYVALDERIILISQENKGISAARNAGLKIATGRFISFIDSDDCILPSFIQELYEILVSSNSDIALCSCSLIDENDTEFHWWSYDYEQKFFYKENFSVLQRNIDHFLYFVVWNKLYKRELFTNLSFVEGKQNEDEFFSPQILYRANKIAFLNKNLYTYLIRKSSLEHNYTSVKNIIKHFDGTDGLFFLYNFAKENNLVELEEDSLIKVTESFIKVESKLPIFYNPKYFNKIASYRRKYSLFEAKNKSFLKRTIITCAPTLYYSLRKIYNLFIKD